MSIVQRKEVSQKSKALLELSARATNILGMAESDILEKGEIYHEMFKTRVYVGKRCIRFHSLAPAPMPSMVEAVGSDRWKQWVDRSAQFDAAEHCLDPELHHYRSACSGGLFWCVRLK